MKYQCSACGNEAIEELDILVATTAWVRRAKTWGGEMGYSVNWIEAESSEQLLAPLSSECQRCGKKDCVVII